MLPLLTLSADFFGVIMGWVAVTLAEPISFRLFVDNGFEELASSDLMPPTLKTMVLGFIIGIIACLQGTPRGHGRRRQGSDQLRGALTGVRHFASCSSA
jgi:ABC-type transporter Mla maintaining outer membrane lipid asymmetry permease subunit MlaE